MNIKVVIVWSFAIVLLFGLGLLGYLNQDILLFKDEPYVPIVDEGTSSVTCTNIKDAYESTYRFSLKNDVIDRISIIYKNKEENIDAYTSASNINQAITSEKLNGLSALMSGGTSDFSLTVIVNPSDYNKARVEEMTEDYSRILMVIDSITDLDSYKQAINQDGNTYTCE
ncbi:MAG: hypothetical protein J1F35_00110 [Erysipelotrichales bacterium]|nr:hypothetical protein [Erysipelotrichales bacterium]